MKIKDVDKPTPRAFMTIERGVFRVWITVRFRLGEYSSWDVLPVKDFKQLRAAQRFEQAALSEMPARKLLQLAKTYKNEKERNYK